VARKQQKAPLDSQYLNHDLPLNKSVELLNYYIGFENYCTSLLELQQTLMEQTPQGMYRMEFRAVVRFTYKPSGQSLDGIGTAQREGYNKAEVLEMCKKTAVSEARKSAYSLLAIVRLNSGKISLHFIENGIRDWLDNES
jgi:hypothetical protein